MRVEYDCCMGTRQTEKALLVTDTLSEEQAWIPQSQIDVDSEVYKKGDEGTLVVSNWFANKIEWVAI